MLTSIIYLLIVVLMLVSSWKVYEKAGRQGWEGIIPIYNLYVMLQIINRPWWWLLIMIFIPIANVIMMIIALKEFLAKFGKGYRVHDCNDLLPLHHIPDISIRGCSI